MVEYVTTHKKTETHKHLETFLITFPGFGSVCFRDSGICSEVQLIVFELPYKYINSYINIKVEIFYRYKAPHWITD